MGGPIHTDGEVTGIRQAVSKAWDRDSGPVHTPWLRILRVTTMKGFSAPLGWGPRFDFFSDQTNGKSGSLYLRQSNIQSTVIHFTDSEQVVRFSQRKRRRSRDVCEHPVRPDCICFRIYAHLWRCAVPFHVLLLYTSAVLHGFEPPRETIRLDHSGGNRNLGDERDRVKRRRRRLCAPHRSGVHWLYRGDRGIRVPHLRGVRSVI